MNRSSRADARHPAHGRESRHNEQGTKAANDPENPTTDDDLQATAEARTAALAASLERIRRLEAELARLRSLLDLSGAGTFPSDGESEISISTLLEKLSLQERKVLMHYIECPNCKEVARRLGTRTQTVQNQLSTIQHKLGVESRVHLAIKFLSVWFNCQTLPS